MARTKKTEEKPVEEKVEETKTEVVEEAPKKTKRVKKTTAKEEKPVEKAPEKEPRTEARATATNIRVTPRKVRLVIDQVRGKDVKVALGLLRNINRAASAPVTKVIKSAAANAINNFGMDEDRLYIDQIWANDGIKMKRYMPRAKGSASGLVKRTSHITVVLKMR